MDGQSLDIQNTKLDELRQLFPELFSEDKLDWEKLKAAFGDDINFNNERYVLNWAGKADAFKALQIPTTATLKPVPEESINFDTTENVFIEGENLEVLKVLQKSYHGKIKCIIIDPPYNTGSDSFIYPDSFKENKKDYEKRIGDKDEEGYLMKEGLFRKNNKDNGHFHSNWLSMMYPRLFLAKSLLSDDGLIFVHIDDNEVHNLRLLMNEIFGEENFVSEFVWQKRITRENRSAISVMHEYVLLFGKTSNSKSENLINLLPMDDDAIARYKNPDNDPRGVWTSVPAIAQAGHGTKSQFYTLVTPKGREIEPPSGSCWRYTKEKMQKEISLKNIWFGSDGNGVPRIKKFIDQGRQGLTPNTILNGKLIGTTDQAKRELVELFNGKSIFETPKPVGLISHLIRIGSGANDIILDFFSGSAPVAQSVIELNLSDKIQRKFILVQLPEPSIEDSEAHKAGYKSIADIGKERVRRVVQKIKKEKESKPGLFDASDTDLGFKVFKLSSSNFKIWRGNEITEDNLVQQLDAFTEPVSEGSLEQNILYELMIKAGYLLTDKVEAKNKYYAISNGELIIALEEMSQSVIADIIAVKPQKVITLDSLFEGNDQLKTNTVLQMRDAGIDFKTI